jgi:hypothetical protein
LSYLTPFFQIFNVPGEFVMVQAAYQSHLGQDCYFAPRAKLADGVIWLLIIRAGISRTSLLQVSQPQNVVVGKQKKKNKKK